MSTTTIAMLKIEANEGCEEADRMVLLYALLKLSPNPADINFEI